MPTILVVDDDPDIRQLVGELLRLSGHTTTMGVHGADALVQLAALGAEERPDLVLLDVQMPELDGWDTLRAIRADPGLADLPVVLCTVKSTAADTSLGWRLGCDGYVVKPFSIGDLTGEIDAVLALDPAGRLARREAALRALSDARTS